MKVSRDTKHLRSIGETNLSNCITIIFEKRWLICLFADADEIDFQDTKPISEVYD